MLAVNAFYKTPLKQQMYCVRSFPIFIFPFLFSVITEDAPCGTDIIIRIAITTRAFRKKYTM